MLIAIGRMSLWDKTAKLTAIFDAEFLKAREKVSFWWQTISTLSRVSTDPVPSVELASHCFGQPPISLAHCFGTEDIVWAPADNVTVTLTLAPSVGSPDIAWLKRLCMHACALPTLLWHRVLSFDMYCVLCALTLAFVLPTKPMLTTEFTRIHAENRVVLSPNFDSLTWKQNLSFYLRFILSTVSGL